MASYLVKYMTVLPQEGAVTSIFVENEIGKLVPFPHNHVNMIQHKKYLKAMCPYIDKLHARIVEAADMMLTRMKLFENLIG